MLLKLFSRVGLLILTVCVALCVAIPALGGRPPLTAPAWEQFGFGYCELPCFAGVIPGQTPAGDGSALLHEHIPAIERGMFNTGSALYFAATQSDQKLSGLVRYGHTTVNEVQLDVLLPLAQLISELGLPDCLLPGMRHQDVTLVIWTRGPVSIAAALPSSDYFNVEAQTQVILMHVAQPDDCAQWPSVDWHGFAPLWDYLPH